MQQHAKSPVTSLWPGLISYEEGLRLQEYWHAKVSGGEHGPVVLLLQHLPVITLGRNARKEHLLASGELLKLKGIRLHRSERGGEITAHMPGQLVVYPIIRLTDFNLSVRSWVSLLEESTISTLSGFGIKASGDPKHPGVWVAQEKIAAVGIRIKKRSSMHGLSINISPDLSMFDLIIPCGIRGRGVTSITAQTGTDVSLNRVARVWMTEFTQRLQSHQRISGTPCFLGRDHGNTETPGGSP